AGFENGINVSTSIHSFEECTHLPLQPRGWWGLIMHVMSTGNDLHGTSGVVTPGPNFNPGRIGKQALMPTTQSILGEWLAVVLGGFQCHIDDALHAPINRVNRGCIHPQSSRDGRSNLVRIQNLAFNLTGFDDILGSRLEFSFCTLRKTKSIHFSEESTLSQTELCQGINDPGAVPSQVRPIRKLVDIPSHSPHLLRIL